MIGMVTVGPCTPSPPPEPQDTEKVSMILRQLGEVQRLIESIIVNIKDDEIAPISSPRDRRP